METLTHHELMKQWRRERKCKAEHCGKSYQEWFEISKERAIQVLSDWACFIKNAKPFDSKGRLTSRWRNVIKTMDGSGEEVNTKKLLKYYKASLVQKAALIREITDLLRVPNIKNEVSTEYGSEVRRLAALEKALAGANSL